MSNDGADLARSMRGEDQRKADAAKARRAAEDEALKPILRFIGAILGLGIGLYMFWPTLSSFFK